MVVKCPHFIFDEPNQHMYGYIYIYIYMDIYIYIFVFFPLLDNFRAWTSVVSISELRTANRSSFKWALPVLRSALARSLGRSRVPDRTWQLLAPFSLNAVEYKIDAVPVLLMCLGFPIHHQRWADLERVLWGFCASPVIVVSESQSQSDRSESLSSHDDSQLQVVSVESFDSSNLSTKQLLNQCSPVDPTLFQSLALSEQLRHVTVRDAAIGKLRADLSEVRGWMAQRHFMYVNAISV